MRRHSSNDLPRPTPSGLGGYCSCTPAERPTPESRLVTPGLRHDRVRDRLLTIANATDCPNGEVLPTSGWPSTELSALDGPVVARSWPDGSYALRGRDLA